MHKRKIIIFGAQGFMGTNLVDFYLKKKHEVYAIGHKSKYFKKNIYNKHKTNFIIIEQNIFNIKELKKIDFENSIIIFAALSNKYIIKKFTADFKKLILFLKNKRINKFLLLSSISVYGNKNHKVNEKMNVNPINIYAKKCLVAEKICQQFFLKSNICIIILRISNVFGTPRLNPGLIEKIILNNIKGMNFKFIRESLLRSYISADTLIKIIDKLIRKKLTFEIFNISNPYYIYTFKNICFLLQEKLKLNKKIIFNNNNSLIKNSICDTKKIQKIFKFKNNFLYEVKKIINYYKKNND